MLSLNDSQIFLFVVATIAVISVLLFFLNGASSIAVDTINFSSKSFGDAFRAQSITLHTYNHEEAEEFGKFERSKFEDISEDCGLERINGVRETELDIGTGRGGSMTASLINLITESNGCEAERGRKPVVGSIELLEGGSVDYEKILVQ